MSCPACFSGGTTTSHPTGTTTTLHGLPTYVTQPDDGVTPKGIIVFIPDSFGWEFVNNRVLCDHYAKKGGFLVYCPDFMNGNAMSPDVLSLMDKITASASIYDTIVNKPVYIYRTLAAAIPWKTKTKPEVTHPGVVAFLQALRTSSPPFPTSDLKIGIAGFCWGGKHAFWLAADPTSTRVVRHGSKSGEPESLIDAVFTAHPSYLEVPKDVEAVSIPMSVTVGDADTLMKAPQALKMKEILDAKKGDFEVSILEGAKHGFAVRTHPEDEKEMECAEKAEVQALEWFARWLS